MPDKLQIKKPVFILGPERSGTTLLYSLLTNADEFYWFSRIDSLFPSFPFAAKQVRLFFRPFEKEPFIARHKSLSRIKGINTPSECNPYWRSFFQWGDEKNYQIKNDRFTEQHLTIEQKKFIKRDFKRRLAYTGKKRILLKQPGFSLKLRFWNRIFPDALYLICVRNIEDNISSLVMAKKESNEKFWGTKVDGWRDYMEADYRTQAILQLRKIYSHMVEDVQNAGIIRQTRVVSYDRLLSAPEQQLRGTVRFCGVKWNSRMADALRGVVREDSSSAPVIDFSQPAPQILEKFAKKTCQLYEQVL